MKTLITSLALIAAPFAAFSQTATSESGSSSESASMIYMEGSEWGDNTPSLGGGAGVSTAPCTISSGGGVVVAGFGINIGDGRTDHDCQIMQEASVLMQIGGPSLAIRHLCKHDETIRQTLVEAGLCRIAD